ncbi:hypothetical protein ACSBR2_017493 [Camellia fascicularis]
MVMEGGAQGDLSVIAIAGIGALDKTTLAQLVYKKMVDSLFELKIGVMGTTSPYHLKGLLEDDSWSLFKKLAFRRRQLGENPSLVAIGKKILTNSGGVPLAIRTVGSLLYLKDTEIEWLVVKDKLWEIAQPETHILPTLKVSYDHLPSHLKPCFAYCSLFPKSCHIEKGTLIKLWMAQWFIHSLGKDHDLKDIADKYFNDLLFRSFFQNVYEDEDGTYHVAFYSTSCSSSSCEVLASMLNARKIRTFFLPGKQGPGKRAIQDALICLENARNGTSRLKELKGANLKAKKFIRKLTLEWTAEDDGVDYADADGKVLEDL